MDIAGIFYDLAYDTHGSLADVAPGSIGDLLAGIGNLPAAVFFLLGDVMTAFGSGNGIYD